MVVFATTSAGARGGLAAACLGTSVTQVATPLTKGICVSSTRIRMRPMSMEPMPAQWSQGSYTCQRKPQRQLQPGCQCQRPDNRHSSTRTRQNKKNGLQYKLVVSLVRAAEICCKPQVHSKKQLIQACKIHHQGAGMLQLISQRRPCTRARVSSQISDCRLQIILVAVAVWCV